jgi:hypothetical protein
VLRGVEEESSLVLGEYASGAAQRRGDIGRGEFLDGRGRNLTDRVRVDRAVPMVDQRGAARIRFWCGVSGVSA